MRTIHFISGLPRAGSTLLVNLLAQNPRFLVTGTSGLTDLLLTIRNRWDNVQEFRAMPPEESEDAKLRVLRAVLDAYHPHPHTDQIVFDKCRCWLAALPMAELLLRKEVKLLVPIRDIRDVLASCEMLWRRLSPSRQIPAEAREPVKFYTMTGRCSVWMEPDGLIGRPYGQLVDAIARGYGNRLFFVPYERLTRFPATQMREIYEFLQERPFEHNFECVEQVTKEDDRAYGMPGLHTIRSKIEPAEPKWPVVLGDVAKTYSALNLALGYPG